MTTPTALPTVTLGLTDLRITRVGFGAWAVGGGGWAFGWGRQDDEESVAAIRHAVEAGVNWVDTAAAYGLGHSEEVVARALADLPEADRPYVFTKCGLVGDPVDPMRPARRVGDPASIRREVEESLRRLRVERIDLYQVHWPPEDGTPIERTWQAMLDLKDEGKIRAAGVSNFSVAQLEAARTVGRVDTLQPPFFPIARQTAADLLPYCRAHEIGVIVYSPMHSGLLSGAWSPERTRRLDEDDWRRRSADFTGDGLRRNLAVAETLRAVGERHGVGAGAVAVAWTLAFDGVGGAIVGARRPAQVDGWLPAATLRLTRADLDEIERALVETGAGRGPRHPAGTGS
ncbi:MAG TPA: aldo/keto reductase [Frankiaceae bacterium]|nr:aldo/keto reductase [Frankiaceae bacterium]